MAAINRASIQKHLWPGILGWFGDEYKDYSEEWSEFFDTKSSSKAYEEIVNRRMFGLGGEKGEGQGITFDEAADLWTSRFVMQTFGLGYIITREAVEDNQYGSMVEDHTRALKRSMKHTKEVRGVAVLNNGFDSTGAYDGGDDEPLFSASHPLANGGTWSNLGAAADFAEGPLEAAITDMGTWTDERGLLISVMPEKLLVANGAQFQAERILHSERRPSNAVATAGYNSDVNAVRRMGALPQGYVVIHRLTDPDAWYIKTNVPNGLLHFQRRKLQVEQGDGFDNQVMKVIATERYAFGWANPRGMYGVAGGT
jgi:hypothetical protein